MHYKRWASTGDPTKVISVRAYPDGTTCSVDGCDRSDRLTRGMCLLHYTRWKRSGDPTKVNRYVTPDEIERGFARFAQVNQRTACWRWLGTVGGNKRPYLGGHLAYRVAYELYVGPIPEGMEIDHLCGNGQCVNPGHLEPVTSAENKRRMSLMRPPYCNRGHYRPVGERCAECDAIRSRENGKRRHQLVRAAAAALGLRWRDYADQYGTAKSTAERVLQEAS